MSWNTLFLFHEQCSSCQQLSYVSCSEFPVIDSKKCLLVDAILNIRRILYGLYGIDLHTIANVLTLWIMPEYLITNLNWSEINTEHKSASAIEQREMGAHTW